MKPRFAPFLLALCLICAASNSRGDTLDLGAYKGKVVYLDFWASWCNPCRQSFPWMNELQNTYRGKGLVVIGVNVDHDRGLADSFLSKMPADFDIVYDPEGAIARRFEFKDMPTSVLIDRDGRVRYVHAGFFPEKRSEYLAHVQVLLGNKAS
jgi:thiol-disulfide isomerase/thioredoxin